MMDSLTEMLVSEIGTVLDSANAPGIVARAIQDARVDVNSISEVDAGRLLESLERQLRWRVSDERRVRECLEHCGSALRQGTAPAPVSATSDVRRISVTEESDIVNVRSAGRGVCREIGFKPVDQIKIATVISELARNAVRYAGGGTVELRAVSKERKGLEVVVQDHGTGIANLDQIFAGNYQSKSGLGMGLRGSKNIMDEFDIQTGQGQGTTIRTVKYV
jgi:serine/threonine-protein kinase RsbT